jgi:hypothetical protein
MSDKRKMLTNFDSQVNMPDCVSPSVDEASESCSGIVCVLVAPDYREVVISSLQIIVGTRKRRSLTNGTKSITEPLKQSGRVECCSSHLGIEVPQ